MSTEKTYELNGAKILVIFQDRLIRIKSPKALQKFLSKDITARSETLAALIKTDYLKLMDKELAIANDSLIIEIWGHVYASYFAKAMKNLINLKLITTAANFIIKRSDTIDCGENEIDSNRSFWDILANFKGIIVSFLPKK